MLRTTGNPLAELDDATYDCHRAETIPERRLESGLAVSDAAIRRLVEHNPGQATFEEYKLVNDAVVARRPCNMLVFGVGRDSGLWLSANHGGTTVFLEDVADWAERARADVPGIVVHAVHYRTIRVLWPMLRRFQSVLRMRDLPAEVERTIWDVVLVDAPRGTRWYRPGRMMSICTASVLARRGAGCDVFVHDTHRDVERACCDEFLGDERLVAQTGSMRHYRVP